MDFYTLTQLIEDLGSIITKKEMDLEDLKKDGIDDIMRRVRINQLQAEINEIQIQRTYYSNMLSDMMTKKCVGCCSGCCRYNYWTE